MLLAFLAATVLSSGAQATEQPMLHSFKLVNAASHVIKEVYVSGSRDASWGENRLHGRSALGPKASASIAFEGGCGSFDIRLVAENGVEFMLEEEEFCGDETLLTVGRRSVTRSRQR